MSAQVAEYLGTMGASFGLALVVSAAAAWPIYELLRKSKARQTVSQYLPEHQKKQGTPTMGGLIVLVGVTASVVAFEREELRIPTLALLLGFASVGFLDDYLVPRALPGARGLGWVPKLALQGAVVGVFLALTASQVSDGAAWLVRGVMAFVVLFYANAFNFTDGLDGLAASVGLAMLCGIGLIGALGGSTGAPNASPGAMAGALLPFLYLNRHPAKLFMGDVGSLPLGAALGASAFSVLPFVRVQDTIATEPIAGVAAAGAPMGAVLIWDAGLLFAFLVLSLVMLVELVPVPLQILSVKLRKKRMFPKTPLHHALEDRGWRETRIVALFFAAQSVCSLLAAGLVYLSLRSAGP